MQRLPTPGHTDSVQPLKVLPTAGKLHPGSGRLAKATMALLRAQVIAHMELGAHEDCLALLRRARRQDPYNLELLRSIRVLEYHLEPRRKAG